MPAQVPGAVDLGIVDLEQLEQALEGLGQRAAQVARQQAGLGQLQIGPRVVEQLVVGQVVAKKEGVARVTMGFPLGVGLNLLQREVVVRRRITAAHRHGSGVPQTALVVATPTIVEVEIVVEPDVVQLAIDVAQQDPSPFVVDDDVVGHHGVDGVHLVIGVLAHAEAVDRVGCHVVDVNHVAITPIAVHGLVHVGIVVGDVPVGVDAARIVDIEA
ncbi:MAG: hypothetical protein JRI68_16185, partial [Deltaproteobacteria bacterium]|nr:hypothetical protein [Deltaproteobacteria bacterium]